MGEQQKNDLFHGDCLDVMPSLLSDSVSLVIADLPYGATDHKWDSIIPLGLLWSELLRIGRHNAVFVFTATQPFASALVMSQPEIFRYEWIWRKNTGSGFANAKRRPLRYHESILVFYQQLGTYNPQPTKRLNEASERSHRKPHTNKPKAGSHSEAIAPVSVQYDPLNKSPESVLMFDSVPNSGGGKLHPSQKPLALIEYLIRTYSEPGDLVLDPTMGSGTTGLACMNLDRRFVGIERDTEHFHAAKNRMNLALKQATETKQKEMFIA